jgi:hypothetical protein
MAWECEYASLLVSYMACMQRLYVCLHSKCQDQSWDDVFSSQGLQACVLVCPCSNCALAHANYIAASIEVGLRWAMS